MLVKTSKNTEVLQISKQIFVVCETHQNLEMIVNNVSVELFQDKMSRLGWAGRVEVKKENIIVRSKHKTEDLFLNKLIQKKLLLHNPIFRITDINKFDSGSGCGIFVLGKIFINGISQLLEIVFFENENIETGKTQICLKPFLNEKQLKILSRYNMDTKIDLKISFDLIKL